MNVTNSLSTRTALSKYWHETGERATASTPVLPNRELSSNPLTHGRAIPATAGHSAPWDLPSRGRKWGSEGCTRQSGVSHVPQPAAKCKLHGDPSLNLPGFLNSTSCHSRNRQWMVIPLLKLLSWFQQSETKKVRDWLYFQFRFK